MAELETFKSTDIVYISSTEVDVERLRSGKTSKDDLELTRLGKKPVLRRNFGFVSMLGFCCTVMATWEGVITLLAIALFNGGFAGSIYGYLFVWAGVTAAFLTMSELASMAPTAAGQYHWVAILAPNRAKAFLSYCIGWLTMVGWQAIVASSLFIGAEILQTLMTLSNPDYSPEPWQTMLFYWALLTLTLLVNTFVSRVLPQLEVVILIFHIFGFLAIVFTLIYFAPHGDASVIFTSFTNGGEWPTQTLSFFVGLSGPAFSLLGPDSPVHMSEEITNSSKNVPRAIIGGVLLNGALGFAMLVAALFCIGDVDAVLSTPSGFPFITLFQQAVGSVEGTVALSAIVLVLTICGSISFVATASRMTWSFARDRGPPFWNWLKTVEPRTLIPLNAIGVTVVISVCLSLIVLGSPVAFNDVVSLSVGGLYSSYLIGNTLLLWRRLKGDIEPFNPDNHSLRNTFESEKLEWGSFVIREPWGSIINAFGCCYLSIVLFFSFWPTVANPTVAQMNYSILMVGTMIILASIYYMVRGHKHFRGPVIETSPRE